MRLINKIVLLIILFSLVIFKPDVSFAKEQKDSKKNSYTLSKTTAQPAATWFTINNVNTILRNDGMSDLNGNDAGWEYPAGSNYAAFYESGFIYGGYYKGEWRVGGSAYDHSQLPGVINADGTAGANVGIYRVRRDYKDPDADFSREMAKGGLTKQQVIDQYKSDWENWPAALGAPYEDVNGNKKYDPSVDFPGVTGADQTIWFVCNDLDPSPQTKFYGTLGLGMEMQATFWGYNTSGALGNAMFRKYQLINKGGVNIDSMFVCMWSDPDLGDAGDDFAGCDTTLSLGYIYNGKAVDATYGVNVPAAGFDFFQGPIVKGAANEQAVFKGKYKAGYKNLPMSAFFFFINSDAVYRDPTQGDKVGAIQWRNLFTGKITTTGVPFQDPNTKKATKFTLSGDPVTGRGWIDGIIHRPNDRRFGMVAGPFTFAAKDTQEVVVGQFAAGATVGVDRLQAVGLLKFNDIELQNTYNVFFQVPPAVKAPQVSATALDQKVALVWGDRPDIYPLTEAYNTLGYKFQGYVVYQLPGFGSTIADGKVVATFDLVDLIGNIQSLVFDPVSGTSTTKFTKSGLNTGIQRSVDITKDLIRNTVLANGTKYYFAVTAYAYNPDPNAVPNVLETPLTIFEVVPQAPNPGAILPTSATTITVAHTSGAGGISDGKLIPTIVNPLQVNGHSYEASFATVSGKTVWNLVDKTTGATKLTNQLEDLGSAAPIVDGLQIQVTGAPLDFKDFQTIANAKGPLNPVQGFSVNWDWAAPTTTQQSNGVRWVLGANGNTSDYSYAYVLTRLTNVSGGAGNPAGPTGIARLIPDDFEIRFTAKGSEAFLHWTTKTVIPVPFEIWDTKGTPSTADDFQVMAWVIDNDADGKFGLNQSDNVQSGGTNDPQTDGIYMVIPIDKTAGSKGYTDLLAKVKADGAGAAAANLWSTYNASPWGAYPGIVRICFVGFNLVDVTNQAAWDALPESKRLPEQGTIFKFITTKPNVVGATGDKFTFTAPSVTYSVDQAKSDVNLINAFPNPYYGANPRETDKYVRFITFSHLPTKATLRIFNLAGQLVNTINKDDNSPYTTWNLANDGGIPVASGLYIVHVDMPDLGATKILKIAIIQEQQILDRF